MAGSTEFYDSLAPYYHLIFDDWDRAIARQGAVLNPLLASEIEPRPLQILDCACGIGTQAIGFAQAGHQVVASDPSAIAVERARHEADIRRLKISFHVSDMTCLAEIKGRDFDVVAVLDNALPHLSPEQLRAAVSAISSKLRPGGVFLASIRNYDELVDTRPVIQEPAFFGSEESRRIVHQVWDWFSESEYVLHLFITLHQGRDWNVHHFVSKYRALQRTELADALEWGGFERVRWLMPETSGFYQPLVLARRR